MKITRALFLLVLTIGSGIANADYTSKWCISEDGGSKCTVQPSYGCPQDGGPGADALAKQACTIHSTDGNSVLNYRINTLSSQTGGKCGISVYEVTCIQPK
ncbi:hypothetical protein [Pseudomonas chlororaphis]|uniref:Secreted protein n=1 Tax=Pseudomonas chlororaphis subsp. aurantiaca TaxID=86192 RepID=A0AAJ1E2X6_9PSED|nr:hypothetical protein [Pseudomonas chlororaphis]MBU4634024.1 hypothetical protein [Pseudomonas chlororaphis subsp. aurantiaca]